MKLRSCQRFVPGFGLLCFVATACMSYPGDRPDQPAAPIVLQGRHAIQIRTGVVDWSVDSDVSAGGISTDSGGFMGSLAYAYFARQDLAVGLTVGVLDSGTSTSLTPGGLTSESATVAPLLVGVTYYPQRLTITSRLLPYVSASAGPYFGSATNTRVGPAFAAESVSEVAFGLRLAGGIDWFTGRHFMLGIGAGYHFVSDFDERIGSVGDYSGPEFSIGLGWVL